MTAQRHALPVSIITVVAILGGMSSGAIDIGATSVLILATNSVVIFTKLGETVVGVPFRFFAFLGNATYSSYLLHFPLQLALVIVVDAIGWKRDLFYSPAVFLAFLSAVIALSLLVHRYFEMPAQRAIRDAMTPHLARLPQPNIPG